MSLMKCLTNINSNRATSFDERGFVIHITTVRNSDQKNFLQCTEKYISDMYIFYFLSNMYLCLLYVYIHIHIVTLHVLFNTVLYSIQFS
jgi:hypothetical protein